MAEKFVDGLTPICADWLNTVDNAVYDALGSPATPNDALVNIGAQPVAPSSGAFVGSGGGWFEFPPAEGITGQVLMKMSDLDYDIAWGTPSYLPEGGVAGDLLTKQSGAYGDAQWQAPVKELPAGGTTDQVLAKGSDGDYDVVWSNRSGAVAAILVQPDPPDSPLPGTLWFESDTGRTFCWYEDPNSSQWVLQSDPGVLAQGGGGGGVPEAPVNGSRYDRKDGLWSASIIQADAVDASQYARVAGGWARADHGALTGLGDDDHAQYFNQARGDARYSQIGHTHADYLPLAGGAMTGDLFLAADPISDLQAATKQYVDSEIAGIGDVSGFPAGTVMLFQQTSAPTGWTKLTAHNDKALRVVSGSVGSGGSSNFSTVFGKTATDAHTLTSTQIPGHAHSFSALSAWIPDHVHYVARNWGTIQNATEGGNAAWGANGTAYNTEPAGGHQHSVSGTTGSTGGGGSHSHNIDLRVRYVDVIFASKN